MPDLNEKTILIVGLGMIGGSIARGLRENYPKQEIFAADANSANLDAAQLDGTVDKIGSIEKLSKLADLIVLAVPPLVLAEIIPVIAENCSQDAVITDVGSVKSHLNEVVAAQTETFAQNFVAGHPIAGSEKSGYGASNAELFKGRNVILTPSSATAANALALVNQLWRCLGANVIGMTATRHDQVLAATSHLPHLLAYAIVDVLLQQKDSQDIFRFAAGGFADFSRVASSDAKMWSDIFVANADATETVLDSYIEKLQFLKESIRNKDHSALMEVFSRAKRTRDEFVLNYGPNNKSNEASLKKSLYEVTPGGSVSGSIRVPGDKSISHRSVIFGALAEGVSRVSGFLEGEDALNTVAAFREMGVTIIGPENGTMTIYGVGMHGLQPPRKALDMGNSGTAMRLMAGLLAAQNFEAELYGDESLNSRPMNRIADPLKKMGAKISTEEGGTPPLTITGTGLKGMHYDMPVASAQVKSCLLLAGLYAEGSTSVTEPAICRDHTERMLKGFAYPVEGGFPDPTVRIEGGQKLVGNDIDIPADISSAAFFLVAASIAPKSDLLLEHVGVNPTRMGVITLLQQMGADITLLNERIVGGEPVADLHVKYSELNGIEIPQEQVPLAIDEFPVLFIAAACAQGETLLRGAEELRVKESDRIEAMAKGLDTLGITVEVYPDGIRIEGGQMGGGEIDSLGDHRIAMAFAVAGLRASSAITIRNSQSVATSFPGFATLAQSVGLQLEEYDA